MDKTLIAMNIGVALLIFAVSLPLVYQKVPPNGWYGFRTPRTMSSDSMWYRTNKIGGQYFVVAGAVQLAVLLLLAAGRWPETVTTIMGGMILPGGPVLVAALIWYLRIRKL